MKNSHNKIKKRNKLSFYKSLSVKQFLCFLLVYILFSLIFGVSQLLYDLFKKQESLDLQLMQLEKIIAPMLQANILENNYSALDSIVIDIIASDLVQGVIITALPDKKIIAQGVQDDNDYIDDIMKYNNKLKIFKQELIEHEFDIYAREGAANTALAQVKLLAGEDNLMSVINYDLSSMLLRFVAMSLVLCLFFIIITWYMIRRPLLSLAKATDLVAQGNADNPPLNKYMQEDNEIGYLATHMYQMTAAIQQNHKQEKLSYLGFLAAGVAHDLNNPLGVIIQNHQNILNRLDWSNSKNQAVATKLKLDLVKLNDYLQQRNIISLLDNTYKSGKRCSLIVNNLLQFTNNKDRQDDINVNRLIHETLKIFKDDASIMHAIDDGKLVVDFKRVADSWQIKGSMIGLQQALLNCLFNSFEAILEAAREQGHISVVVEQQEGDKLAITINDNGVGISKEDQDKIYDPFYSNKSRAKGSGLGLAIVKHIIEKQHQGLLSVYSQDKQGAAFTIIL